MKEIPKVSIGMPVFNGARFIRRALDSLLEQDFEDYEIVISDNASTDGTGAICREYADRHARIRYQRNDANLGAVANFNLTFEMARGRYFKWAAHDDYLDRSFLARCVEGLDNRPEAVLCYTTQAVIDDAVGGRLLRIHRDLEQLARATSDNPRQRFHTVLWYLRNCHPVFGLFRSSALRQSGLIRNAVEPDRILLGEMSLLGPWVRIPEPLFYRGGLREFRDGWTWLRPSNPRWLRLGTFRMIYHHAVAVIRSPLRSIEKLWLALDALVAILVRRTRGKLHILSGHRRHSWRRL